MRFLVRSVPQREQWLPALVAEIPHLEIVRDRTRVALDTFLLTLLTVGDDAAVLMEDDAEPCRGLVAKVEAEIARRPNRVINFFSRRKEDLTVGSRFMSGGGFLYNLCVYFPPTYCRMIYEFCPRWRNRVGIGPGGTDSMVADWLKERGESYWQHVPSLVQHRVGLSAIDRRRPRSRQSPTFVA
jgi:hypothetical protein